ncbi:FRG domain-containing protein [Bacillus paranthracis]|uniref:FRG domain-containing protein n=1 Tax=Bacillus paranthracis TaxID=2026186 RepID=UPI003BAAEB27
MTKTKRYSQRELEEVLPTPDEIEVDDLASYIKLFSDGEFEDFYFRGEPTNYKDTVSSALRGTPVHNAKVKFPNKYPFFNIKKEFKREVWHKLSPDERMYFSAFSQHHGIPTNLIDITTSPLVSLYFACQEFKVPENNKEGLDATRGFVYLFKDSFVDITNILAKYEDDNVLELFALNRRNIFIDMYNIFLEFKDKYPEQFYQFLENIAKEYHDYFGNLSGEQNIPKDIPPQQGCNKTITTCYVDEIIKYNKKLQKIHDQIDDVHKGVFLYTSILQMFSKNILEGTSQHVIWFKTIMPIFKYAPILSFERGRNQQGLFIYQNYLNYIDEKIKTSFLCRQKIWPEVVIVVNNKEKILNELDFIGINEKFIYGDYDHIASYIRNKFQ